MGLIIVGAIGLVALGGGVALAWFVTTAGEPRARTVAMVGGFAFAVLAAIVTQALLALLGAEPALLVALSVAVLAAAALFFLVGNSLPLIADLQLFLCGNGPVSENTRRPA